MDFFDLHSPFTPTGDQPEAIDKLTTGIINGERFQTLLGVTGSGKTFTMANVIAKVNKPTLILAHNKTLAAQLYSEFKEFFPNNAVEYFVSYYDYYQPEAYIPQTDTFIEKDASTNDEIDKMRNSATSALFERNDVIIVASVSCIYGLGDPDDYKRMTLSIRVGNEQSPDEIMRRLIGMQYERNDISFTRNHFRLHGDVLEIFPSTESENAVRVEFFGDEVERISEIDSLTGELIAIRNQITIFPASHYVTTDEKMARAIVTIGDELASRLTELRMDGALVEAQRLESRTNYDLEMMSEVGFCPGIENYSRHISGREPGSAPFTLMDYFPDDFLLIVDESHVTLPQVRGMFNGDRARKQTLIKYGFRLPSALDNRPFCFEEFEAHIHQAIFTSATPGEYEYAHSTDIAEQLIRPTGLLDPRVEIRPIEHQIDDLLNEIHKRIERSQRVLVTTLTKKMAEDLSEYLKGADINVTYMHSETKTIERTQIIHDLRTGVYDVLVGINLLREGLDIPEVSLVAIFDADKEGFLRSEMSLVQTIGRAARNSDGTVILYADSITGSMERAIKETNRRRKIQDEYNKAHGIVPKTVKKAIRDVPSSGVAVIDDTTVLTDDEINKAIDNLTKEMLGAASRLEFETAAALRDKINELKEKLD